MNPHLQINWTQELGKSFRTSRDLLTFLELKEHFGSNAAEKSFPVLVTRHFASLIRKGDPSDPLLKQVLAIDEELERVDGFTSDPVGDSLAVQDPGILQKYQGRTLLLPTGACAIHCRHCFRREFPYESILSRGFLPRLQAFLEMNSSLEEVILSGGDPLMLEDGALEEILQLVEQTPQIKRIRFHTRLPVVLPSRFTPRLYEILKGIRKQKVLVVHVNHPQELDEHSGIVFKDLQGVGMQLLNQSVLLQGVNDSPEVLKNLSERLFSQGVLPYYLHQLDRVHGAAHFEVSEIEGRRILKELAGMLPGYLVPRYVREIPGEAGKTSLY